MLVLSNIFCIFSRNTKLPKFVNIFREKYSSFTNKAVLEPRVSPAFAITYFCNHCNIRFENTSKYVDTLTLFSKNLNQRSLTPGWPLTPCLLRSHVWLYPRIIVSKSHDKTSMYVDTVINFAKYHIHTHTYYILHTTYRMSDHIVSYWTQFRRDMNSVQARQKGVIWKVIQFRKFHLSVSSLFMSICYFVKKSLKNKIFQKVNTLWTTKWFSNQTSRLISR